MKKIILLLVVLFLSAGEKSIGQSEMSMQGAYSLIRQTGATEGSQDSLLKKDQFKIYTDRYFMYASPQTMDTMAIYGIGTYRVRGNKVTEYVFYSSMGGKQKDTIELNITKTDTGYTQVIRFPGQGNRNFVMTEVYQNVGKPVTSPLDGAWEQERYMEISREGDTTHYQRTQYKVYQSGYFIWANTYPAEGNNQPISSFGYGTFQLNGDTASREVNTNSTFITDLVGVPINIQLEWMGQNRYKQTITNQSGSRSVEIYRRLK